MMLATADPVVPVDFRGNELSLDDIKAMIARDVADLGALYELKELDEQRAGQGIYIANRRLLNQIALLEKAHDEHWAWYRARIDATT